MNGGGLARICASLRLVQPNICRVVSDRQISRALMRTDARDGSI